MSRNGWVVGGDWGQLVVGGFVCQDEGSGVTADNFRAPHRENSAALRKRHQCLSGPTRDRIQFSKGFKLPLLFGGLVAVANGREAPVALPRATAEPTGVSQQLLSAWTDSRSSVPILTIRMLTAPGKTGGIVCWQGVFNGCRIRYDFLLLVWQLDVADTGYQIEVRGGSHATED